MRIGLIGLGRIGAFHADTLAALDRVDELVVTDPVAAAVDTVTTRIRKATAVGSPEAVLDSGVDGVVIAATTGAHAELLLASAGRGIPTFCEKPIAGSADEAVTVRDRLAGSGVAVQIGYPRRFDPAFVAARDAVRSGELGRVTTVRSTTLDPAPPPAAYLAGSGGIFRDCSVHDFDAVRWVTGQEAVEVYAVGTVDTDKTSPNAIDPMSLTFDGGAQLRFSENWVLQATYGLQYFPGVSVGKSAFDPRAQIDCVDAGYDYNSDACIKVRLGYGIPTASGDYQRFEQAIRITLHYFFNDD